MRLPGWKPDPPDLRVIRSAAAAALREGRPSDALVIVDRALAQVRRDRGDTDPATAATAFLQASVRHAAGDRLGAIESCRLAASVVGGDRETVQARLTYIWNLGQSLAREGRTEEAVAVLEANLLERRSFYGPTHPGAALGMAALAEAYLRHGLPDAAAPHVEKALAIAVAAGRPEAVEDRVLRCVIEVARDPSYDVVADLTGLRVRELDEALDHLLALVRAETPAAIDALWAAMRDPAFRQELEYDRRRAALITLVNEASTAHRYELGLDATDVVIGIARRTGDRPLLVDALAARAHALDGLGRHAEGDTASDEALALTEKLDDPARRAIALRNHAIRLGELGDAASATAAHAASVTYAESTGRRDLLGRALGAAGIHAAHAGVVADARRLLERAIDVAPPEDDELILARSHLRAVEAGERCGCGDPVSVAAWLLRRLQEAAPPGLVRSVEHDRRSGWRIDLSRAPTPEELERLDPIVRLATASLRTPSRRSA